VSAAGAAQQRADSLVWLLTVEAERTYRWRSRDCAITVAGVEVAVRAGLRSDDVQEELDRDPGGSTIGFSINPADVGKVAKALRYGLATLAILPIRDGVARVEDGVVAAGGYVGDVEADPDTGQITIGMRAVADVDSGDVVPASQTIDKELFPAAPDASVSNRMPLVYGAPGSYQAQIATDEDWLTLPDSYTPSYETKGWGVLTSGKRVLVRSSYTTPATPAYAIDYEPYDITAGSYTITVRMAPRYVVIAHHAVEATSVSIWTKSDTIGWVSRVCSVRRAFDGLDRTVSLAYLVDTLGSGGDVLENYAYRRTGEWFCAWDQGRASSGLLSDVLTLIMSKSAVKVDWQSIAAAREHLDRFTIGGYLDESITPLEWAQSRLPTYGCALRWSADGVGVVVTTPIGDALPVARFEVGRGCARSAPLRITPGTLDEAAVVWAASNWPDAKPQTTTVRREAVPIPKRAKVEAPECWDDTTAVRIGRVALWKHGPEETIGIAVDAARWWWIRAGDVVDLTDAASGYTAGDDSRWLVMRAQHTDASKRNLLLRRIVAERVSVET